MNFVTKPMYDGFYECDWFDNYTKTDYEIGIDTNEDIDVLLYTKRIATYMKCIYVLWFVFIAMTMCYDHTRTRVIYSNHEVERKMKILEERIKKSMEKTKQEMKKFKKNMREVNRTNKEIYRLQQQIFEHYERDDKAVSYD
jgi:uncharacterized membrane protein